MASTAPSFSITDYAVFSLSLLVSLGIGIHQWYTRRGKDTEDFFMGGRHMSVIPVSLSFTVGIVSAVSILGNSSEMYYYGTQLWMNVLGLVIGSAIAIGIVIPVMYPLKLTTIYEYLELRWSDSKVKKLAIAVNLLGLLLYLGIALYAPSLAISSVTPITVNASIIALGLVCCIYASLGGSRAVVYTDNFQALVLVAGVVMVVVKGSIEVGGAANSWAIVQDHNRIEFFNLSLSPLKRHTLMTTVAVGASIAMTTGCVSQPQYQRWGSVSTINKSYAVMVLGIAAMIVIWSLIYYSGLVVFSVYADCDPLSADFIDKTDQILMYFVADKLGYIPGAMGIFVAAVYSGVLSSASSILNSISAVVWKDVLQPLETFANTSEKRAKIICIIISACMGVIGVLVGMLAGSLGGLVQMAFSVSGALGGPITGIFLTAVLCPWVKSWSVFLGALCSLALSVWIVVGNMLYADPPEMLSLSTAGCPGPDPNTTTTTDTTILATATTPCHDPEEDEVFPLYRVSYCLFGGIGTLATIFMSTVFSCILGFAAPSSVTAEAVNRMSFRFYCWIRGEDALPPKPGATNRIQNYPAVKNMDDKSSMKVRTESEEYEGGVELSKVSSGNQGCDNPITITDSG